MVTLLGTFGAFFCGTFRWTIEHECGFVPVHLFPLLSLEPARIEHHRLRVPSWSWLSTQSAEGTRVPPPSLAVSLQVSNHNEHFRKQQKTMHLLTIGLELPAFTFFSIAEDASTLVSDLRTLFEPTFFACAVRSAAFSTSVASMGSSTLSGFSCSTG